MNEFQEFVQKDRENWDDWSEQADDSLADKNEYVRDMEGTIMQATGVENSKKESVQKLTGDLKEMDKDKKAMQKSLKELAELRKEEHEQHEEVLADITKTIEAVNKAIEILEGHYAVS